MADSYRARGIRNFRTSHILRQRNGISGTPFYAVWFSYDEDDVYHPNMLGILRDDGEALKDTECYVIDINDQKSCWRGDCFGSLLIGAVKEFQKAEDERLKNTFEEVSKKIEDVRHGR